MKNIIIMYFFIELSKLYRVHGHNIVGFRRKQYCYFVILL